jgi:YHS domain-containing protein
MPRLTRIALAALALAFATVTLPSATVAQAPAGKILVNTNREGIALQGYDAVSFFTDGKPVKGDSEHSVTWRGATYLFASAEHEAAFQQDPAKYEPQFGGFCAWAVSRGYTAKIDISTWQVVGDRLIFNYSRDVQKRFNQDVAGNLAKADQNWPKVVEEQGQRIDSE